MRRIFAAALALTFAASLAGCRGQPKYEPGSAELNVTASSTTPVAGDTVTLSAQTENVYGRSPKIRWEVPGARVQTQERGRVARVTFRNPGEYVATAYLKLNDGTELQDSTTIQVGRVP